MLTKFRSRFVKFPWQFCSSKCCIIYNSRKYNTCILKYFIIIWFHFQVINHTIKTGWTNGETSSKLSICYAVSQKKHFFLLAACASKWFPSKQDKRILFIGVVVLFRYFYPFMCIFHYLLIHILEITTRIWWRLILPENAICQKWEIETKILAVL